MFAAIRFAITYLPLVVSAVQLVENFVKAENGQDKKKLAIKFVREALERLGITVPDRMVSVIDATIEIVVVVMNAFGIFGSTKGDDEEAVAVMREEAKPLHVPAEDPNEEEFQRLIKAMER